MRVAVAIFFEKHWDALLAMISANIFIYLFTRHSGIGISPDSVSYYTAAENIRNHFSFTDFTGLPLIDFPLGYPFFLAACSFVTTISPLAIAPVVNAILFCGVMLFTSIILNGYKKNSRFYKVLLLSILACSPFLLEVYSMLWSETLFIFLSLLFCICVRYYFLSHSYTRLALLSMVTALAFNTRYAGISLVLAGGMLIFFDGGLPIGRKIKHLLYFGNIACSLVFFNLIHNHYVSASLTGVREKALRSVADNIVQVSNVIAEWLPFLKGYTTVAVIIFLVIFTVAIIVVIFRVMQQQYYCSYETIIASFFITYTLFIISVASISRFEDLSNRLLSPVYIPLLLIATSWVPMVMQRSVRIKKNLMLVIALFLYGGIQYHQYQLNAEAWEGIKDAGIPGYSEDSWQTSPTIHFVRQHKKELAPVVYSDAYDAVYFLTRLHAYALPHKEIQKEIDLLLQQPDFSVIWLNDGFNADLIDIDFIKQHKKLVSVKALDDGAIYRFADSVPR